MGGVAGGVSVGVTVSVAGGVAVGVAVYKGRGGCREAGAVSDKPEERELQFQ